VIWTNFDNAKTEEIQGVISALIQFYYLKKKKILKFPFLRYRRCIETGIAATISRAGFIADSSKSAILYSAAITTISQH